MATRLLDWLVIPGRLTEVVNHYANSAPTVSTWADDLFVRCNERADEVRLSELALVDTLWNGELWLHPNYAANAVYKLQSRLGQDTTGHAGF